MDRERAGSDRLLRCRLFEELLGDLGGLPIERIMKGSQTLEIKTTPMKP